MSSAISSNVNTIYKSRLHILDIMEKNGYNVDEYKGFNIHEVATMFSTNQLDMLITKTLEDGKKNKIYISYYTTDTKLDRLGTIRTMDNLMSIINELYDNTEILTPADTLFIITKDTMTDTLLNCVKHIWEQDGIFVVIQSIKQLQYNILNHELVPSHRILSDMETRQIEKQYNISNSDQFPDISRFDAVAQVICIRPGQVCEIIRSSKTSITSKYYRRCINTK